MTTWTRTRIARRTRPPRRTVGPRCGFSWFNSVGCDRRYVQAQVVPRRQSGRALTMRSSPPCSPVAVRGGDAPRHAFAADVTCAVGSSAIPIVASKLEHLVVHGSATTSSKVERRRGPRTVVLRTVVARRRWSSSTWSCPQDARRHRARPRGRSSGSTRPASSPGLRRHRRAVPDTALARSAQSQGARSAASLRCVSG